jgi:hypothetical protein
MEKCDTSTSVEICNVLVFARMVSLSKSSHVYESNHCIDRTMITQHVISERNPNMWAMVFG